MGFAFWKTLVQWDIRFDDYHPVLVVFYSLSAYLVLKYSTGMLPSPGMLPAPLPIRVETYSDCPKQQYCPKLTAEVARAAAAAIKGSC